MSRFYIHLKGLVGVTALACLSAFLLQPSSLVSAAPVAYSGKLTVFGFAHDGPGHFRFQLIDQDGNVLWRNSPNDAAVTTQVTRGHYSVLLGDDTTPNMAVIPPRLFLDHPMVFLRVHFSEGSGNPFHHLQPDQRILSASHALTADTAKVADSALVADLANAVQPGGITAGMLTPGLLTDLNASGGEIIQPGSITAEMFVAGVLEVDDGSITAAKLSETILQYLRPEITSAPQSQTVYSGGNVSFSVSAEGKYLTYQWKRNGQVLTGETNTNLVITDANATLHDGNYTVVVSNDFGSVDANNSLSFFTIGESQQQPASSGSQIKQLYPSSANGIYWIGENATNAVQAFVDMDNGGWVLLAKLEPEGSRFAYSSQDWGNNSTFGNSSILTTTTLNEAKSPLWATLAVSNIRLDETNSSLANGKTATLDLGGPQTLSNFFTNSNGAAINTTNGSMLSFSRKDGGFQGNSGTHAAQVYVNRSVSLSTSFGCSNLPVKVRLGTTNIHASYADGAVNTGFYGLGGVYYYKDAHNGSCCDYTIQGPFNKNTSGEYILLFAK